VNTKTTKTICFLTFLLFFGISSISSADEIPLSSFEVTPVFLKPANPVVEIPIYIDTSTSFLVDVACPSDSFEITLYSPLGQIITPDNVSNFNGQYVFDEIQTSNLFLVNPMFMKGIHYAYYIENPVFGTWKIIITGKNLPTDGKVGIVNVLKQDSTLKIGLLTDKTQYILSSPVLIMASIFDGSVPISGASVVATIKNLTDEGKDTIILRDDGNEVDNLAGDGLYSGEYVPLVFGNYAILVEIGGKTTNGTYFSNDAFSTFSVRSPLANFNGFFSDQGIDTNGNNLYEYIALILGMDVSATGTYRTSVTFKGSNGIEKTVNFIQELNQGINQNITVRFAKKDIFEIGVDGPYNVAKASIELLEHTDWYLADEIENPWETQAYSLNDFERGGITLTGSTSDAGIDTNNNNLFDILRVNIEVDLLTGGNYQWSARLVDSNNTEINFAGDSKFLNTGINSIDLSFDGCKIGENGADGPYNVTGLLIFGVGKSLLANNVASTETYNFTAFECAAANHPPEALCQNVTVPTEPGLCTANASADAGSFDPAGDPITLDQSPPGPYPFGTTEVTLTVTDDKGASDSCTATVTVEDQEPPAVQAIVPDSGEALQDGVTFQATASDNCGVDEMYFYVREADGGSGGYEDLPGAYNGTSWEYNFDTNTPQTPDGYYVILAKAVDMNGNEGWSTPVPVSIRNWAVVELLPNTANNKAGRTMPVKFALRIAAAVDSEQPFVYNEELEIRIYDKSAPDTILQTSLYGDTSTDYRIDTAGELYITNFKTSKTPAEYVVEIWRMSKNFLVGSFTFETVK
jgi:hypothetical protein